MIDRTNRRDFLKTTALGLGAIAASQALTWAEDAAVTPSPVKSSGEKVNIACVGVGGKGDSDSDQAGKFGNIVAICDVDENSLNKKAEKFPQAKKFTDFRKMFDEMEKQFDAVTVSTPDHMHAAVAMRAIKAGKHVYCQKPLTHTVWEARQLREAAREHKVITQMGNQGTSEDELRRGVELIRGGVIGAVKEVHVWTNRPVWPQAPEVTQQLPEQPVPANLHWEEWIGTAPMRPYNKGYHPFKWRGFRDFGTGALGDMGCHTCNLPFMALGLGAPTSLSGEGGDVNPETYPSWATVHFEFPERGAQPPVKFVWWEGHKKGKDGKLERNLPAEHVRMGFELPGSGSMMIGEKGTLFSFSDYGTGVHVVFGPEAEGFTSPPKSLPRIGGGDEKQKMEWIDAIKGGSAPMSNFDYAGQLTEFILLGNIAILAGKKLEWDAPNMKFPNAPEFEKLLKTDYREGWTL